MNYSVRELFEIIDQPRAVSDFYNVTADTGHGARFYLGLITAFEPNEKTILTADCHQLSLGASALADKMIDVSGLLLYRWIMHDDDFTVTRLENLAEAEDIMLSSCGVSNIFTGDIVVLENGVPRKYQVRGKYGTDLRWYDLEEHPEYFSDLKIEWL